MQLLAYMLGIITYRGAELLIYTPFTAYQMWGIDKKFGLAEPTVLSFAFSRVAMWLEFVILVVPVSLLIIKMMEWTENYIVLAFFCCTAIVKLSIVYLYPIICLPLFS